MLNAAWAILFATEIDDSIELCTSLFSSLPLTVALYDSGAQIPNRIEAAVAKTAAIHVVQKIRPLRFRRGDGLEEVLLSFAGSPSGLCCTALLESGGSISAD